MRCLPCRVCAFLGFWILVAVVVVFIHARGMALAQAQAQLDAALFYAKQDARNGVSVDIVEEGFRRRVEVIQRDLWISDRQLGYMVRERGRELR